MITQVVQPPINEDLPGPQLLYSDLCRELHALFGIFGFYKYSNDKSMKKLSDVGFILKNLESCSFKAEPRAITFSNGPAHLDKVVKKGAAGARARQGHAEAVDAESHGYKDCGQLVVEEEETLTLLTTRLQLGYWEMEGHPVEHYKLILLLR